MNANERFERALKRLAELQRARGLRPATIAHHRRVLEDLQRFLTFKGKSQDLRAVGEADVVSYLRSLAKRLNPQTIDMRLSRLRALFRFFHREGLVLADPTRRIKTKRRPLRPRPYLTVEEMRAVLQTPDTQGPIGIRDRAFLELGYSSALRLGELLRLELDDLELTEGFVFVGRTTKSGYERQVPVGRIACQWLAAYCHSARPRLMNETTATASVFLSRTGAQLHPSTIQRRLADYGDRAGIAKRVSPHVLRHSCAVHMLTNGASSRHVQELLGHRTLSSTQIYTRLVVEDLRRALRRAHPRETPGRPRRRG